MHEICGSLRCSVGDGSGCRRSVLRELSEDPLGRSTGEVGMVGIGEFVLRARAC